ncbi:Aste57867_17615 [Aphanomyces stellatus]|uniref:Aste57867_17615 protein n=1 Tax=Aphanomyces stellatus TaxID=120398 RepID=A0A485L891_9STRA|nr:hypothetical protein As57867_017555 [Aphanomyces stellatus]VFT94366.1 Aste57867_17615 [Aphanomyces stellatus]
MYEAPINESTDPSVCHFNGCNNPVMRTGSLKCHFHRKRGICNAPSCHSQVNKHGLCVAHGARSDPCRAIGCSKYARVRGLCHAHYKQADHCATALVVTMEPFVEGEEELESLLPMDPMLLEILDFIMAEFPDKISVASVVVNKLNWLGNVNQDK